MRTTVAAIDDSEARAGRTPTEVGDDQPPGARSDAAARTLVLACVLIAVGAGALLGFDLLEPALAEPMLSWWAIALIAVVAQLMVFDVELRRDVYTFTFSEIPLVLGLFLADPAALLVGRLLGEFAFLLVKERHAPRKIVLNVSTSFLETVILLATANALGSGLDITDPRDWLIALVAVAVTDLCGYVIVFQVLRWHGSPITLTTIVGIGGISAPVNTSFALIVGILLRSEPWATWLLASVAAFLMLSYRSYTSLRKRYDSLELLYDFTRLVSGARQPDDVLEAMLNQAKNLLRAERAVIWLRDANHLVALSVDDDGRHEHQIAVDEVDRIVTEWFTLHPGTTLIEGARATGPARELATRLHADDAIVAPVTESGSVIGLVAVVDRIGEFNRFAEPDRSMFSMLAGHAGVALENGRLIARLHQVASTREHEARHDALTELPNRSMFNERLRRDLDAVERGDRTLAVGLLDLDGFKQINDTLGHQTGDEVLVEVSQRLRAAAGPGTLVSRLGGDEFAFIFPDGRSRADVEAEIRVLLQRISRPMQFEAITLNVFGSIGVAMAPQDGVDGTELVQRADVAMYSVKAAHGSGIAFYDSAADDNSPRRLQLATDLRAAIERDELDIVLQPKVRFDDGTCVGVEALCRWRHGDLGPIPPDEFVPIAEHTGSIRDLTATVMRRALTQTRSLETECTVSVNVATRNLMQDDFVPAIEQVLAETGCDPSHLLVEVTETGAMLDTARVIDTLERIAALGVGVSVDDFGTGYSTLSYLHRLPADEVKIDKSFTGTMIHDHKAAAIVRSIIELGHNLGIRVVAEGVENDDTWERLAELGCDVAQGYHIARPMPIEELASWQRARGPRRSDAISAVS